jgi:alginate O-acetyltransferase complex protein AlgI
LLFNSLEYLIFLPTVVFLFFVLPHKFRWILLLAASFFFYMYWKPEYILLIIFSTLVDYFAGIMMDRQDTQAKRKKFLLLSIFLNLGLLFVFKYFNFFNAQFGSLYTHLTDKTYPVQSLRLLLPIGISFYTFQTLSYSIDVYRGKRKAERHLGYFSLYVTFFPQLVAGPIERSENLLPRLHAEHQFSYDNLMIGILRICWGMFKKVIIADRVAVLVNSVYGNLSESSGFALIIATIGFALQIYCDFSGYSDIAIGSAKIMGIDLMENFKTPYLSKSINEFWTRWHISLSTWFKDYLYIPLGGNRTKKRWQYYMNIFIVFIVSGFWHGAEWTFLVWGALHGVFQIFERITRHPLERAGIPGIFRIPITFAFVCFAWIFFRADNMHDAMYVISHIGPHGVRSFLSENSLLKIGTNLAEFVVLLASIAVLAGVDLHGRYQKNRKELSFLAKGLLSILLIVLIVVFGYYGTYQTSEFIYFQF